MDTGVNTGANTGATKSEPHFSQPLSQIFSMLVALGLVAAGVIIAFPRVGPVFLANPFLNGFILFVFVIGVLSCFAQVWQLINSVAWIEGFAGEQGGAQSADNIKVPGMLAPLATLLSSRGSRMQLSASSSRSILESVAQRIDETREITRYIVNTLIFLGLLGTFYGLATTVPALVDTIRSLSPQEGETGAEVFTRLQEGLESQLGGMGIAFASSLLGLAGSLVVGLLELFTGHGQNRFYRELEEWLSTITRVGLGAGDEGGGDQAAFSGVVEHMVEQMDQMQAMFADSEASPDRNKCQIGRTVRHGEPIRLYFNNRANECTVRAHRDRARRLDPRTQRHGHGRDRRGKPDAPALDRRWAVADPRRADGGTAGNGAGNSRGTGGTQQNRTPIQPASGASRRTGRQLTHGVDAQIWRTVSGLYLARIRGCYDGAFARIDVRSDHFHGRAICLARNDHGAGK